MKETKLKGTYVKINLDHIVNNYKEVCRLVGPSVEVSCVVKSDAYGHGENQVVQALVDEGISLICVSTIIEGLRLRKVFPNLQILILGYTPKFLAGKAAQHNLIQTISTLEEAMTLQGCGKTKVHIKVNSGMNRLGFSMEDCDVITQISKMKNIEITGILTHFYSSDRRDKSATEEQFKGYMSLVHELEAKGVLLGTKHVCNSAGIIDMKHMYLDMVREGIMLYGLYPSKEVKRENIELKEAMEFISYIAHISQVKKGEGISYGHTFIADKDMTIATINLGYGDGVFRQLSNKGEVIIGDQRRPIVGTVCMNMFMVDITGLHKVQVEDEVIIFGKSKNQYISIDEVAKRVGTISYEVVCRIGYSVPRAYIKNNQIIQVEQEYIIENKNRQQE